MHVSKLSKFIQSDVPSNTLLLGYQMNSEQYLEDSELDS